MELSVVWDCMQALNRLGKLNKITLTWIPGHQDILGMRSRTNWRNWGLKRTRFRGSSGSRSLQEGKLSKAGWRHLREAKQLMKCPQLNRAKDLLAMKRDKLRIDIGLFTGHVPHLYKLE